MDERSLARHEANEIETFVRRGLRFFGIDPDSPPEPLAVVARIDTHLASVIEGTGPAPSEEVVVALGALMGQQYVRALGWKWTVRVRGDGLEAHVVADPERRWVVMPIQWVFSIVSDEGHPVDVLVAFQKAVVGDLPKASARSWLGLH